MNLNPYHNIWTTQHQPTLTQWQTQIQNQINKITQQANTLLNPIKPTIQQITNTITNHIKNKLQPILNQIKTKTNQYLNLTKTTLQATLTSIITATTGYIHAIKTKIKTTITTTLTQLTILSIITSTLTQLLKTTTNYIKKQKQTQEQNKPTHTKTTKQIYQKPIATLIKNTTTLLPQKYPLQNHLQFIPKTTPNPITETNPTPNQNTPQLIQTLKKWKCYPLHKTTKKLKQTQNKTTKTLKPTPKHTKTLPITKLTYTITYTLEELLHNNTLITGKKGKHPIPPQGLHAHNIAKQKSPNPNKAGTIAYPHPPNPNTTTPWIKHDTYATPHPNPPETKQYPPPTILPTPKTTTTDKLIQTLHTLHNHPKTPPKIKKLTTRTLNDINTQLYHHLHPHDLHQHGHKPTIPPLTPQATHTLTTLTKLWQKTP